MDINKPRKFPLNKIFAKTALVAATVLGGLSSAHAGLVATSNSVVDSATNLEWLKVPLTVGMSYNAVLASSYVAAGGYAFATEAQIHTLFTDGGGVADTNVTFRAENEQPAKNLIQLFGGCTSYIVGASCGNNSQYWTLAMWGNGSQIALMDVFDSSNSGILSTRWSSNGNLNASYRADVGSFLVRRAATVPEPASLALAGIALLGIGAARRQRKS